jgi:hypothetical protein
MRIGILERSSRELDTKSYPATHATGTSSMGWREAEGNTRAGTPAVAPGKSRAASWTLMEGSKNAPALSDLPRLPASVDATAKTTFVRSTRDSRFPAHSESIRSTLRAFESFHVR